MSDDAGITDDAVEAATNSLWQAIPNITDAFDDVDEFINPHVRDALAAAEPFMRKRMADRIRELEDDIAWIEAQHPCCAKERRDHE